MLKKIESLREKPKEVRNRFAFWVAFLFTAMIIVFWIAGMSAKIERLAGKPNQDDVQGGLVRSFSSMKASVLKGFEKSVSQDSEVITKEKQELKTQNDSEIDFVGIGSQSSTSTVPTVSKGTPVLIGTTSTATTSEEIL